MKVRVRRLQPEDDRSAFHSGNAELDRFFLQYAGQNQFRHHIGTTYVAVDDADQLLGFATVAASELVPAVLPAAQRKQLPRYPVPVLRLARFGVDQRLHGAGIGRLLLGFVIAVAEELRDSVGGLGVVVDAKSGAIAFYEKLGFITLEANSGQLGDRPEPMPMFLALETPKR